MTIRAIVLDFDGVVVESNQIKHQAFSDLFSAYPEFYEQVMEYHRAHNAVDRHEKFRYVMEHIMHEHYSPDLAAEWADEYARMTREKIARCPYVNGALEMITDLKKTFPFYLASATPSDELYRILSARGIAGIFKEVYGAPMKKAIMLKEIARREDVSCGEILFIGDSREDYVSARESGCMFIGRISGYDFHDVPSLCFKDLYEIKAYIVKNLMNGGRDGLSDRIVQA